MMPMPRKPRTPCLICGAAPRKATNVYCSRACRDEGLRRRGNEGMFLVGQEAHNALPIGTVRVRRRTRRPDGPRAWVKVAEPGSWRPRAVVVWEATHGAVPVGCIVHHLNHDTLDDDLSNLALLTRAEHLAEHRPEFESLRARRAAEGRWGS